jgi:hypothetical protein
MPYRFPFSDAPGRRRGGRASAASLELVKELTMKKFVLLFLVVLLYAVPARAADVDGKWTGSVSTPNGDITVGFEFKSDGATLTGSTTGLDGAPVPIKNGKIDGNKISFLVSLDFGGMPIDLNYSGIVSPVEIKMTAEFAGMPFEFTVKKN